MTWNLVASYGRTIYGRGTLGPQSGGTSVVVDFAIPAENASSTQKGGNAAYARGAYGRTAFGRSPLAVVRAGGNSPNLTADAIIQMEAAALARCDSHKLIEYLAGQRRDTNKSVEALASVRREPTPYVGLADIYGPAVGYWGLRAVSAAAAAARVNAIQLRRASDNTTQDITVLPNGNLDLAIATAFLAGTTGYISTWYDQSGNGYHMSQASTAKQPQFLFNAIGGQPAAIGDGATTFLEYTTGIPDLNSPALSSSFVLPQMTAINNVNYTYLDSVVGGWQGFQRDGFGAYNFAAFYFNQVNTPATNDIWYRVQFLANNASSSVTLNGTTTALTFSTGNPQVGGPNALLCDLSGISGPYQQFWKGYMTETSIFPISPSAAQLAAADENQNAFWVLQTAAGGEPMLEETSAVKRGATPQVENLGASSVTEDTFAPLDALMMQRGDRQAPAEITASLQRDAAPPVENLAGRRADATTLTEALATALCNAGVAIENTGALAVSADQIVAIELIAAARSDSGARASWSGSLLIEGQEPIEFLSSSNGNLIADASAVFEWLARPLRSALTGVETAAEQHAEFPAAAEALSGSFANIVSSLENLSIGSITVGRNLSVPIEFSGRMSADSAAAAAWELAVNVTIDYQLPAEIDPQTPSPPPALYQVSSLRVRLLRG